LVQVYLLPRVFSPQSVGNVFLILREVFLEGDNAAESESSSPEQKDRGEKERESD